MRAKFVRKLISRVAFYVDREGVAHARYVLGETCKYNANVLILECMAFQFKKEVK